MHSNRREEIGEVLDALDAALERACALSFEALTNPERLRILVRPEKVTRQLPVPGHALINQPAGQASRDELGARLCDALADRLRITRRVNSAHRRGRRAGPRPRAHR